MPGQQRGVVFAAIIRMSRYCGQAAEELHKQLISIVDAQTGFVMECAWRQVRDETLDWVWIRKLREEEAEFEDKER